MKITLNKTLLADIISWLFIVLFIYAANSKFLDYKKFEVQIGKSPLLFPFSHWVVWAVPSLEIAISIVLLSKRYQLAALYAALTLMLIFTGYIVIILNYGAYIPCSCGGILENMNWKQHLVFNSVFDLLGIVVILIYPENQKNLLANKKGKPKTLNRVGMNIN
jgi:uncharacterized membrane protein YphA (DoxX/SURF4 family)